MSDIRTPNGHDDGGENGVVEEDLRVDEELESEINSTDYEDEDEVEDGYETVDDNVDDNRDELITNHPEKQRQVVWLLHNNLGRGGAERWCIDTADALARCNHQVTIFAATPIDSDNSFSDLLRPQGYDIIALSTGIPTSFFGRFVHILTLLKMIWLTCYCVASAYLGIYKTPDIIVLDITPFICHVLSKLLPTTKLVYYCHFPDSLMNYSYQTLTGFDSRGEPLIKDGCDIVDRQTYLRFWYKHAMYRLEAIGLCHPNVKLICNSEFTKKVTCDLFKGIEPTSVSVLYPTWRVSHVTASAMIDSSVTFTTPTQIEGNETPIEPIDRDDTQSEYQAEGIMSTKHEWYSFMRDDSVVFLSLNRIHPAKRLEVAIKAFLMYRQKLTDPKLRQLAKLIIAGHAQDKDYLHELMNDIPAEAKGSIQVLTDVSDYCKAELLRKAQVLIYTPIFEHFGIGVIEALALGKPIIASKYGGPSEILSVPGLEPLLIEDPYEVASYANAMVHALKLSGDQEFRETAISRADFFSFASFFRRCSRCILGIEVVPEEN